MIDATSIDAAGAGMGLLADSTESTVSVAVGGGSVISGARYADVVVMDAGSFAFADSTFSGATGAESGDVLLNGNGIFAYGTPAWDEAASTGLSVIDVDLPDTAGAALLLVDASAQVCGIDVAGSAAGVVQQECTVDEAVVACEGSDVPETCSADAEWPHIDPDTLLVPFEPPDRYPESD